MARILFIDDDIFTLETYEKIVSFYGHEALLADIGSRALELACQEKPDLILMDQQLPDIDGFALLKKFRADEAIAQIPVVMVTASHDAFSDRAIAEGAQDFVSKPFLTDDLLGLIEKYTSEA